MTSSKRRQKEVHNGPTPAQFQTKALVGESQKRERDTHRKKHETRVCELRLTFVRIRSVCEERALSFAWLSFLYSLWALTEPRACTNKVICTRCSLKPDWLLTHTAPRHPPSQANKAKEMLGKRTLNFFYYIFVFECLFSGKGSPWLQSFKIVAKLYFSVHIYSIRNWFSIGSIYYIVNFIARNLVLFNLKVVIFL